MKKLLLVTERFWPEEFIVNDLAAEGARRGYAVTVLTQQPSYPQGRLPRGRVNAAFSRETWQGVEVLRIKTVLGYRESLFYKLLNYLWFSVYGSMAALSLRRRFDRVLIYQTGPLTMAIPGILFGKVRRIPVAIWTQDVWPDSVYAYGFRKTSLLSGLLDAFVRWIYRSAGVVLISCRGFARILGKYTEKPMTYAPNWPLSPYKPSPNEKRHNAEPVFLFAGNVGKVQNLENVIRGYSLARGKPGFLGILRIVGDGSALEGLKALSIELEVPVEFAGRKHSSQMDEEYARADFLVLSLADSPVFRLTVPSKFQMYLSVGKPILCAAEGEVRTLVRDLDLGADADADSIDALAQAFIDLTKADAEQVSTWGRNASAAYSTMFNRSQIIESIVHATSEAAFDRR
jgi:glycosyltransferase involved in cell wall biosynthesis